MSLLEKIRSSQISRAIWIVVTINFVNLTANFTEQYEDLDDPVDTISEMLFEWGLDGDADTIPDNSEEDENQSSKKLVFSNTLDLRLSFLPVVSFFIPVRPLGEEFLTSIFIPVGTPPPTQV